MDNYRVNEPFKAQGLYDPAFEHDNCGIGAVVNIKAVEVFLHNAAHGIAGGVAGGFVNLHQHIEGVYQNVAAAHAGINELDVLRREGGVFLANLSQLRLHLRLLLGFFQIILPFGFKSINFRLFGFVPIAVFQVM